MKKTRHSGKQIAFAVKQAEAGIPVAKVIRRMGISERTFRFWTKVYRGLSVGELRRLKLLGVGTASSWSRTSVSTCTPAGCSGTKALTAKRWREIVAHVQASHGVSERRSCRALGHYPLGQWPEFISKVLNRWADENGVTLDFSRPGKPTDNAFGEPFNGRMRDKCLNMHWFLSLDDARTKIEA